MVWFLEGFWMLVNMFQRGLRLACSGEILASNYTHKQVLEHAPEVRRKHFQTYIVVLVGLQHTPRPVTPQTQ